MDIRLTQTFKSTMAIMLAFSTFLLFPDMVYGFINHNYIAGLDVKSSVIAIIFAISLSLSRYKTLNIVVGLLFFIWQCSQLMYFHYYGGFYSAFDIELMFYETADAASGFWDVISYLIIPAILSITFFGFASFIRRRYQPTAYSNKGVSIFLIVLMCIPFIQSLKANSSQKFQPNIAHSSLKNGFYSYSYFLARQVKLLFGIQQSIQHYQAYELSSHEAKDANVIVIMGESLSFMNMSLFGYERDTTPALLAYKKDPNFIYKPSLSSAVSTRVSLALFFNTVYEPDNVSHVSKMNTSLFKLAKESGFDTHYISTQKNAGGLSYSFSPSHIDEWREHKHLTNLGSDYDDRLVMYLDQINFNKPQRQFVTLHMRSAHTPYVENYPKSAEVYPVEGQPYEDYMRNSYDNSVLFTQQVIADLFAYFKKIDKPTYVFFTSDHGELTGQNGRFGHNAVDLNIAKVPFLFYGVNIPKLAIAELDRELGCLPNHYIISKKIAEVLGATIHNPNEQPGQYYLNGTDVFGNAGFVQYSQAEQEKLHCLPSSN